MMKKYVSRLVTLLVAVALCVTPVFAQETIILIHTNDTHGSVNDDGSSIGFAKFATLVEAMKEEGNALILDAGDMFQGTPFANIEQGLSVLPIANAVGYDAMVPGNHEFDYGADHFLSLAEQVTFPIISANVTKDGDVVFPAYIVKTFGDVKVGVFGLTTPETAYKTHPDNVIGYTFEDIITSAQSAVDTLKEVEEVISPKRIFRQI